jgi:hypothetical protein
MARFDVPRLTLSSDRRPDQARSHSVCVLSPNEWSLKSHVGAGVPAMGPLQFELSDRLTQFPGQRREFMTGGG